jgi:3-phosphoshikimate 1-carboxyvinyltransferase
MMQPHESVNDPVSFLPGRPLHGETTIPGDKSISHRSLMISSQMLGPCHIHGLLESEDVMHTLHALRALGVTIEQEGNGWLVQGAGPQSLQEPVDILNLGNAGTGVRLLMGLVSAYPFQTFFTGDASLSSRPMGRVIDPLSQMGATFHARQGKHLPCMVTGGELVPMEYRLPVASAQVKSAILLAALNSAGKTTVIEEIPSRDHTERMLQYFGLECRTEKKEDGYYISLEGQQPVSYQERDLHIPGDPSSAAFLIVAALMTQGSEIRLKNICYNPARIGLFEVLQSMGAEIRFENPRENAGEPVVDISVKATQLKAVTVPASMAPSMIDEYPILAVAAAVAEGTTIMQGLAELRHKESDRLQAMFEGLKACGADVQINGDDLIVVGKPEGLAGGATIHSALDHRIAMSFLVLGLRTQKPVHVTGCEAIATSFPGFIPLMQSLGVQLASPPIASSFVMLADHSAPLIIAIDGPAASGKGTLGRRLAEAQGLVYLDTGSLYRAVGMKLVYNNQDPQDVKSALEAAATIQLHDLNNPRLRQERVGQAASVVSAIPQVREVLLEFQRKIAHSPQGAVLDGRDIGTVVCPEATLKLFVTANLETRAQRRHRELQGQGITVLYESVLRELEQRDERDKNRKKAPLKPADDATIIDTSGMSADDVFERALELIRPLRAA